MLEFFKAEILAPDQASSPLLHGRKGPAFCHVDGIDSVFTRGEARAVACAVKQAGGAGMLLSGLGIRNGPAADDCGPGKKNWA